PALAAGRSAGDFYATATAAGALGASVSAGGMAPAPWDVTVAPAAPVRLRVVSAPATAIAGDCVEVELAVGDAFGNAAPIEAGAAIALAGADDSLDCPGRDAPAVAPGASSARLGLYATRAGDLRVEAAAAQLAPAAIAVTVAAGRPALLALTAPPARA